MLANICLLVMKGTNPTKLNSIDHQMDRFSSVILLVWDLNQINPDFGVYWFGVPVHPEAPLNSSKICNAFKAHEMFSPLLSYFFCNFIDTHDSPSLKWHSDF